MNFAGVPYRYCTPSRVLWICLALTVGMPRECCGCALWVLDTVGLHEIGYVTQLAFFHLGGGGGGARPEAVPPWRLPSPEISSEHNRKMDITVDFVPFSEKNSYKKASSERHNLSLV